MNKPILEMPLSRGDDDDMDVIKLTKDNGRGEVRLKGVSKLNATFNARA